MLLGGEWCSFVPDGRIDRKNCSWLVGGWETVIVVGLVAVS